MRTLVFDINVTAEDLTGEAQYVDVDTKIEAVYDLSGYGSRSRCIKQFFKTNNVLAALAHLGGTCQESINQHCGELSFAYTLDNDVLTLVDVPFIQLPPHDRALALKIIVTLLRNDHVCALA